MGRSPSPSWSHSSNATMLEPASRRSTVAHEVVERLDPLDRVALDRRAQALAHRPEQVDEDAAAQQPVDLVLARGVPAHQPLERGRLVRRVVVDVHLRDSARAAAVEKSMSRSNARFSPASVTSDGSFGSNDQIGVKSPVDVEHAEEVVDAVVERVRVALEVEEQVASVRLGGSVAGRAPARSARPEPAVAARRSASAARDRRPGCAPARGRARCWRRSSRREAGRTGSARPRGAPPCRRSRAPSALRCRAVMPATSERWSSSRRRWTQSSAQRQTSQCSTGSG